MILIILFIISRLKHYYDGGERSSIGAPHIASIYPVQTLPISPIVRPMGPTETFSPVKTGIAAGGHGRTASRPLTTGTSRSAGGTSDSTPNAPSAGPGPSTATSDSGAQSPSSD